MNWRAFSKELLSKTSFDMKKGREGKWIKYGEKQERPHNRAGKEGWTPETPARRISGTVYPLQPTNFPPKLVTLPPTLTIYY